MAPPSPAPAAPPAEPAERPGRPSRRRAPRTRRSPLRRGSGRPWPDLPPLSELAGSSTAKAAGLAVAQLAANGLALAFTVAFARLLGAEGYGSLAALVSTFLILAVPGSALQVAAAREIALGRLGGPEGMAATLRSWTLTLAAACAAAAVVGTLARHELAALISVEETWAAAATVPTGCLWLLLSLQRGALQGLHAYRPVGLSIVLEALGRLACGLALFAVGAGVTGAYLGTPLSMLLASLVLAGVLRRRLPAAAAGQVAERLRDLVAGAWLPVAALFLLAVLQNVDVILVKREVGGEAAGAYAAAAVAAKAIVWVAIGVGLHLLPEATRRAGAGLDPRPVLGRALVVVAAVAAPTLVIYALAPAWVLSTAFGPDAAPAADALRVLGPAMTLLAAAYLCVQYLLALHRVPLLAVLAAVACLEIVLLSLGLDTLVAFAAVVLGLQALAAAGVLALGLRRPGAAAP